MTDVRVTFYSNFRYEDTSHVTLDILTPPYRTVRVFATAGTFTITVGIVEVGEFVESYTTGPIFWNASAATLQAALQAAVVGNTHGWDFAVTGANGGPWTWTESFSDVAPNGWQVANVNLSGYMTPDHDEVFYDVPLTPAPDCGVGQETPVGVATPGEHESGRLEALHEIGGRDDQGARLGRPLRTPPPTIL